MQNVIGPPVREQDFVGRSQELAHAWSLLRDNHLLLSAPRSSMWSRSTAVRRSMKSSSPVSEFIASRRRFSSLGSELSLDFFEHGCSLEVWRHALHQEVLLVCLRLEALRRFLDLFGRHLSRGMRGG